MRPWPQSPVALRLRDASELLEYLGVQREDLPFLSQPLAEEIDVHFTPHMARHTLGTRLNASGAGLKTIMAALGHSDPKSSLRYQAADIETARAANLKLTGDLRGKSAERRRKSS